MLSMYKHSFTSSSAIWVPLMSFSWLVTVARTSSKMSNGGSKRVHPRFIFDLRGKALTPLPLDIMLSVVFHKRPLSS